MLGEMRSKEKKKKPNLYSLGITNSVRQGLYLNHFVSLPPNTVLAYCLTCITNLVMFVEARD